MNSMEICARVLFFAVILMLSLQANAEIYRWVDSNGKVHYSDNSKKADGAEVVKLTPINTMEGGGSLTQNAARRDAYATQTASQTKQTPTSDPCKADIAMYKALTEQQFTKDGRPKRYYLNNSDGSSMTEKEQAAIIDNLGQSLRARGCL